MFLQFFMWSWLAIHDQHNLFVFLWIIKSFQDFMLKGTNKLIPFVAAGLTYPSLPLSPCLCLCLSLFLSRSSLSSSLVPMAHQTWGGWVAWLPERKKLKSHKGISPPLFPLMNAVFCGRQSGRRSTQRDDRAHSRGECVSACVPFGLPIQWCKNWRILACGRAGER